MYYGDDLTYSDGVSLSARRAWIEIMSLNTQQRHLPGRSPQGERG